MICSVCRNNIQDGMKYCTVCGSPMGINPSQGSGQYSDPSERTFDFSQVGSSDKTEVLPSGGHGMPEIPEYVKDNVYVPDYHTGRTVQDTNMNAGRTPDYGAQNVGYGNGNLNGSSFGNQPGAPKKKSNAKIIIILVSVAVILAAIAVGLIIYFTSPSIKANKELNLGQNYLDELDYEEAIACFEKAIKIDPKCEDAYLGMADAYIAMDDYPSAIKILEKGYKVTKSETIKDRLDEVQEEYDAIVEEERLLEEAEARAEEEARIAKEEEERRKQEEEERARQEEEERRKQEAIDNYFNGLTEGFEVGQLMPDFAMKNANGQTVYISDYRGQVVFLNFFTTWCPYCYNELPGMASLDCKVLMVDLGETPQEVNAYMSQYGYNFEVNYLSQWKIGNFEIEGVPTSFVIDEYGIIRAYQLGQANDSWMKSAVEEAKTAIYRDLPELEE